MKRMNQIFSQSGFTFRVRGVFGDEKRINRERLRHVLAVDLDRTGPDGHLVLELEGLRMLRLRPS